ncbi:hypothetical protein ACCO45_008250 [Purpureocillium lilacinum]|uniref:Uncharacterized protein n=1 Tax=Purpureocillium lilacinum TaxID=33203 RepID=A0ACC4DNK6_PURLI
MPGKRRAKDRSAVEEKMKGRRKRERSRRSWGSQSVRRTCLDSCPGPDRSQGRDETVEGVTLGRRQTANWKQRRDGRNPGSTDGNLEGQGRQKYLGQPRTPRQGDQGKRHCARCTSVAGEGAGGQQRWMSTGTKSKAKGTSGGQHRATTGTWRAGSVGDSSAASRSHPRLLLQARPLSPLSRISTRSAGPHPLFKSPPTSASFRLVEVQRAGQCDRGRAASAQMNPVPAVSSPSLADRAPGQATASAHSVHHITPPERGLVTITGHCTADAAQRVGRLSTLLRSRLGNCVVHVTSLARDLSVSQQYAKPLVKDNPDGQRRRQSLVAATCPWCETGVGIAGVGISPPARHKSAPSWRLEVTRLARPVAGWSSGPARAARIARFFAANGRWPRTAVTTIDETTAEFQFWFHRRVDWSEASRVTRRADISCARRHDPPDRWMSCAVARARLSSTFLSPVCIHSARAGPSRASHTSATNNYHLPAMEPVARSPASVDAAKSAKSGPRQGIPNWPRSGDPGCFAEHRIRAARPPYDDVFACPADRTERRMVLSDDGHGVIHPTMYEARVRDLRGDRRLEGDRKFERSSVLSFSQPECSLSGTSSLGRPLTSTLPQAPAPASLGHGEAGVEIGTAARAQDEAGS